MAPVRVVPTFQPGEDRHAWLGPTLEATTVNDFSLQCRKETLGHRVIVSVSGRAHRGHDAGRAATLAERIAGVLAAAIRMMDDRFGASTRVWALRAILLVVSLVLRGAIKDDSAARRRIGCR